MRSTTKIAFRPDQTLEEALREMDRLGAATAPVMSDGQVVGYVGLRTTASNGHTAAAIPAIRTTEEEDHEAELRLAKRIQQQLLPRTCPLIPGLAVYGALRSASAVGGDYWSVKYYRDDERVTLKLADVTGHGIAAALLVPAVKYISGGFYRGASSPEWVISRTNHVLVKETPVEVLVSMVYGWYDTIRRTLRVVNAGHRPAFVVRGQEVEDIPTTGPVMGLLEGDYQSVEYRLAPGDLFFVCSDGIMEARSDHEFFGEERIKDVVLAHRHKAPPAIAAAVFEACSEFGGPPHDDRSLLVARAT